MEWQGAQLTYLRYMKHVYRKGYGHPDILEVKEGPVEAPKAGELQIRLKASTVNRTDMGVLTGEPYIFRFFVGWPRPKYHSTGTDFAGIVEQVGEGSSRFKVGDEVWGFFDHGLPSHAEFMTIPERTPMQRKPKGMSFAETVASAEAAHYAYNFMKHAKVQGSERILVFGATGGIGSAMVQLLKAEGCEVTAVYDSRYGVHPEGLRSVVERLGADKLMDASEEDFTSERGGYDGVFDAVGKSRFKVCKALLKPKGYYISSELGPGAENIFLALSSPLRSKKVLFPFPSDIQASLDHLQGLMEAGKFRPLMDRSYPLEQIQDAFRYVMSGMKVGNVWIDFS